MSVISESVSHSSLVSAVSNWNIQSDGLDIRAADTPMPRERIFEETMQLLSEARARLTENPIPALTCNISGDKYQPKSLPKLISCELSDIVYLITCKKCGKYYVGETGRAFRQRIYEHRLSVNKPKDNRVTPVSKHFTGTNHSIKDMQFSILEWCTPKYNTPSTAHRRRREQWWMWNIGAVHPTGINQFI